MQNVIETDALCKRYGSHLVVDHLALTVPEGCVYGFLGPNGAGKSTTMKMLLGLVHPTGGTVRLLGREMTDANRLALLRQTGSLIESPSGYLHLTARENLEIVADLKGVPHNDIARVLDIVQLTNDQHRKVGQYSLGMKQRLGIAMALLGSPKLLVLDEPTNGPRRYPGDAGTHPHHARRHRSHCADLQPSAGRDGADGGACGHHRSWADAV